MSKGKYDKKKKFDFGPDVEVMFQNNETPGVDISFNYQGRGFGPMLDGRAITIPLKVMTHLNSLETPQMELRPDPATGIMVSTRVGAKKRFMCSLTNQEALIEAQARNQAKLQEEASDAGA